MNKAHLTYKPNRESAHEDISHATLATSTIVSIFKENFFHPLLLPFPKKKAKYWGGYIKICLVSEIKHCIKRSIIILVSRLVQNIRMLDQTIL